MNNLNQRNTIALAAIIVGLVLLAQQYLMLSGIWTLTIIGPGVVLLYAGASRHPLATQPLMLGAAATVTGLILLYQSIAGRWETWSYMWALYPVARGLVFLYVGQQNDNPTMQATGQTTLTIGLLMLAGFGIFFEGFIYNGSPMLSTSAVAVGLLLIGGYLWLTQSEKTKRGE